MKKNILLFVSVLFILTGCENFLEPKSQDKIIPKSIDHLREFFLGEVIMTDKEKYGDCLLYTSPSPRDVEESRMPSSA